jgi:hypothetical protein
MRQLGDFPASLAALRRAHELGQKQPGWGHPSAAWVRQAERLVELDDQLPALLRGDAAPKDAAEQLELAHLCSLKKRHAASARFYADAFAARPPLADNPALPHRYNAACVAALAGCGVGTDPARPDKEQAGLRRQALGWLRGDLEAQAKRLKNWWPGEADAARQFLQYWKQDPDLAAVRDKDALDKLPEPERDAWRQLWQDVDALLQRAVK